MLLNQVAYRHSIIELVTELFPSEDHDRWFLAPHSTGTRPR